MDISDYLKPIRKWWWLLGIAVIVAAGSTYLATRQQPDRYQARTTLTIGRSIEDPNPTSGDFFLGQQLAATYADITNREPVRLATMESLELSWLPEYFARAIPNSQLIEIQVTDIDPLRAQVVANELANQLILRSPTSGSDEEQQRQEFLNRQLDDIQNQIDATTEEMVVLKDRLGTENSARQIADLQNQIAGLETKLTTLQSNYAALLSNTERGAVNTLTVIEPASLPQTPIGPGNILTIGIAAAIGLTLAVGVAFLLEYLDKSLKTPEEVERLTGTSIIGFIPDLSDGKHEGKYISDNPRSAVAEAFRSLRTNLEFAAVEHPLHSILITGPSPEIGKSSVAVNLAVIMAQSGKKITLVDADLRRPNIHNFTRVSNDFGLADILQGDLEIYETIKEWDVEGLAVIPAGTSPPNPAELLGSPMMPQVLSELKELCDVVIIDGPPFIVADASVLASKADGSLLVIRPGYTHKDPIKAMMDQINRVNANVLGVVFNRIPKNQIGYYGRYWQYAASYSANISDNSKTTAPEKKTNTISNRQHTIPRLLGTKPSVGSDESSSVEATTRRGTTDPLTLENVQASANIAISEQDQYEPISPPRAVAYLRWEEKSGNSRKLILREGDTILVGRDRINDIPIHSRHVSRRHAVITWRTDHFEIADLGSTNGTSVNGSDVDTPISLNPGDMIQLYDYVIIFDSLPQRTDQSNFEEGISDQSKRRGT